ncbi:hypothetical protein EDB80DRAFT_700754 [Ilyonectria destructans]|nr:hypothetical protein EDB80DRAFT_700754 [Ilyonectria destructans]
MRRSLPPTPWQLAASTFYFSLFSPALSSLKARPSSNSCWDIAHCYADGADPRRPRLIRRALFGGRFCWAAQGSCCARHYRGGSSVPHRRCPRRYHCDL